MTDTTERFPCLVLRCRRQSGRETSVTEREREGDMTQEHVDRSGGGWRNMACFAARRSLFFSRPESGVICMTDDDFARVVVDKGKEEEENRRRKKFVIGEK